MNPLILKHAKITQHKGNRHVLNTQNLHSDLKATFTYPLTGYDSSLWRTNPATFGRKTLRSMLQTGHRTLQHSYQKKKNYFRWQELWNIWWLYRTPVFH